MPADLSGSLIEDSTALAKAFRDAGWPVGEWAVRCNTFIAPVERDAGVAHVLIRKSEWDKVTDKTSLTLTFTTPTGTQVQIKKLVPVSAPTPLPQEQNPADPVLWLRLEDWRTNLRMVQVAENYNLRRKDGTWDTGTLNAGTPYTWAQVVDDLWAKLKAAYTDLPSTAPTFPATPTGTPEDLQFDRENAWDALCDVVQDAGYLVKFDPRAADGGVTIIDPQASAPAEASAAVDARWWDTAGRTDIPEPIPEQAVSVFRRIGRRDYHAAVGVSLSGGSPAGSKVVLRGRVQAAGDPVSNTAYLDAYAFRLAQWWRLDVRTEAEPRAVEYQGYQEWAFTAVGYSGYASWGVCEQAYKEVTTVLSSGPLCRILDRDELVPEDVAGCTGYPFMFRVQVGTSVTTAVVSGTTVVTSVTGKFRDVSVDENGCISLGTPYCAAADSSCSAVESYAYWCIGGVCWKVYDGIVPPSGSGPFATAGECTTACPGGTLVSASCGTCTNTVALLTASLGGGFGSIPMPWNGTYWQGSKLLSCGETLHLRYSVNCVLEFSCNGTNWASPTILLPVYTCSPTFSVSFTTCDCNMDNVLAGCAAGSCGTVSVTSIDE